MSELYQHEGGTKLQTGKILFLLKLTSPICLPWSMSDDVRSALVKNHNSVRVIQCKISMGNDYSGTSYECIVNNCSHLRFRVFIQT